MSKSPYPSIPAPDASLESVAHVVGIMKIVLDQLTGQVTGVGNAPPRLFVQGTPPTATKIADLWINTASNNALKYWNGSAWAPVNHA